MALDACSSLDFSTLPHPACLPVGLTLSSLKPCSAPGTLQSLKAVADVFVAYSVSDLVLDVYASNHPEKQTVRFDSSLMVEQVKRAYVAALYGSCTQGYQTTFHCQYMLYW